MFSNFACQTTWYSSSSGNDHPCFGCYWVLLPQQFYFGDFGSKFVAAIGKPPWPQFFIELLASCYLYCPICLTCHLIIYFIALASWFSFFVVRYYQLQSWLWLQTAACCFRIFLVWFSYKYAQLWSGLLHELSFCQTCPTLKLYATIPSSLLLSAWLVAWYFALVIADALHLTVPHLLICPDFRM